MSMGSPRGGDDFFAGGVGFAVGDVLGNRAKEKEGFLQHQADVLAVFGNRQRADINAVEQNRSLGDIVEAADEVDHRALARTTVANEADHFSRFNVDADVACDAARAVAEADVAQFDVAGDFFQMYRLGWLGNARHMVENIENALGARCRFLRNGNDAAH